jgi:hypothetical protein
VAIIAIPGLVKFSRALKRSQQWKQENGHERAERREYDWYWNSDPEKKPRELTPRKPPDRSVDSLAKFLVPATTPTESSNAVNYRVGLFVRVPV